LLAEFGGESFGGDVVAFDEDDFVSGKDVAFSAEGEFELLRRRRDDFEEGAVFGEENFFVPGVADLFHRGFENGERDHLIEGDAAQVNGNFGAVVVAVQRFFGAVGKDGHVRRGKFERFLPDMRAVVFVWVSVRISVSFFWSHSSLRPVLPFDINFRMQDPVIIITGAGKGIGKAIAEEVFGRSSREKGFKPRLFVTSRTLEDLKPLQAEGRKLGLQVEIEALDIADSKSARGVAQGCMKAFGRIDCLINNAGVGRFGDFLKVTEEDIDYVLQTNLKGTFLLTQEVFRQMSERKSGHIVFVTSIAARKPFEQSSVYCMSKSGQQGLVDVLRLLAQKVNVRITDVMPGATYTPMCGEMDQATIDRMMPPSSVAKSIIEAILLPPPANLDEIVIRPVGGDL
jgi:sepiapterin reductase